MHVLLTGCAGQPASQKPRSASRTEGPTADEPTGRSRNRTSSPTSPLGVSGLESPLCPQPPFFPFGE
eukprot:7767501-Pyramimonas_sp.AAC.1